MKLKLVGGDSAGVVTAYYMCSENGAGPTRDELDIEFLGNRTGQPYLIQTNVYKNGTGNREMRHQLWFDPTEDFHSYSILWNSHQILFSPVDWERAKESYNIGAQCGTHRSLLLEILRFNLSKLFF
ncbi:unnamed protein product [Camellia sinensis]